MKNNPDIQAALKALKRLRKASWGYFTSDESQKDFNIIHAMVEEYAHIKPKWDEMYDSTTKYIIPPEPIEGLDEALERNNALIEVSRRLPENQFAQDNEKLWLAAKAYAVLTKGAK